MVAKKKLPIRWDKEARGALKDIYDFISLDSVTQAKKVKAELLRMAGTLNDYPEKYSIEPNLILKMNPVITDLYPSGVIKSYTRLRKMKLS